MNKVEQELQGLQKSQATSVAELKTEPNNKFEELKKLILSTQAGAGTTKQSSIGVFMITKLKSLRENWQFCWNLMEVRD